MENNFLKLGKYRQKFIDEGKKYLILFRQNKKRPLTPEEEKSCEDSEQIMADIEKELGNYKNYLSLNNYGKNYRLKNNGIKKTSQRLEIRGWKFIKACEYQNTCIFKSPDGNKYLHFGDPLKIKQVTDVQLNLYKKGYPVPQVLKTGNFGKYSYLLESSLGDETYGDIFTRGIEGHTFQSFCPSSFLLF